MNILPRFAAWDFTVIPSAMVAVLLAGCASTKIESTWKSPELASKRIQRFAVFGVSGSPSGRIAQGFSLHADTWLHENDIVGLERLCNYGARGPLSLERLSALPDGRLAYRMKRPSPTGQTHLVLPPVAFLRRVAALVPPPRANLVRYFGVFAPNARVRPRVVPAPPPPAPLTEAASCPVTPEPLRPRPPRRPIPWAELLRRTFHSDVLTCPRCGGTRRVVAVVLRSTTAQAIREAPPAKHSAPLRWDGDAVTHVR